MSAIPCPRCHSLFESPASLFHHLNTCQGKHQLSEKETVLFEAAAATPATPASSPEPTSREGIEGEKMIWRCSVCGVTSEELDFECKCPPVKVQLSPPSIAQTLQERGERYGDFETECTLNQNIMTAFEHSKNWRNLPALQKHALTMIAMKITRVLNGDADYPDNFRDISGYATLAERSLGGIDQSTKKEIK